MALLPKVKILLDVDKPDEETELLALRAGARGCVSRRIDLDTLLKAFVVIGRGEYWVSHGVATHAIGKLAQSENVEDTNSNELTPREWEILGLLAKGARNKEIANALSVSENTVKTHLFTIYRKVNVDCRLAATLYYFEHSKRNGKFPGKPAPPQAKRGKADVQSDHKVTPTD
jgi:DNA-binding NarL/FixJ family response regulator